MNNKLLTVDIVDIRLTNKVQYCQKIVLHCLVIKIIQLGIITKYYKVNYIINLQMQIKKINCKIESKNKYIYIHRKDSNEKLYHINV